MWNQEKVLKTAFLVGAITDALALFPMLIPSLARFFWGFEEMSGPYQFAMGYAASLMTGWTVLLIWAYQKPLERKFIAAFTMIVVIGLIITEVIAVFSGYLVIWRIAPTWILQAILLCLFASGFHYPRLKQWCGRMV